MQVERAKPLLGTIVAIRARFPDGSDGREVVEAAFAEIAGVHRLMSFHDRGSEVSRLNREAASGAVQVDGRTFEVLAWAQALAGASGGAFDVTAAGLAVSQGALPRPAGAPEPDGDATWRDIRLEHGTVAFERPLWIDLGGVAKGYAVDRAIAVLTGGGAVQATVNAGGDLAVCGAEAELVLLSGGEGSDAPVLELADGAVASSGGPPDPGRAPAIHLDVRRRRRLEAGCFVSVAADGCMAADSLTKVVMAEGAAAADLLEGLGARAWMREPGRSWQAFGAAA